MTLKPKRRMRILCSYHLTDIYTVDECENISHGRLSFSTESLCCGFIQYEYNKKMQCVTGSSREEKCCGIMVCDYFFDGAPHAGHIMTSKWIIFCFYKLRCIMHMHKS